MVSTISTRASSLGAATILVGAALIAALTATHVVSIMMPIEPETIISVQREPEPLKPPPPPDPTVQHTDEVIDLTPISFNATNLLGPPRDTLLPVGPSGPATISNPHWLHIPTDLERFYPTRANARGMEGQAVLDCQVSTLGALNCAIVSETPVNWGFGDAALRIAREYTMEPATRDGMPIPGRYRMVVPFTLK